MQLTRDGVDEKLVAEFLRIKADHDAAIVRTVARGSIPGSVSRVFAGGTKAALVELLPTLAINELPGLDSEASFRAWYLTGLDGVAQVILDRNPADSRPRVHPGYKWGHATKVLSLFVRDLVILSRHVQVGDATRIAPWLYCPVDGIVIERLRSLGVDLGVTRIRELDEPRFWTIQDRLGAAARRAGVPRVWFDDIWSEAR